MLWTGCSFVEIDGFIKGNYCFGKNPNCLPEKNFPHCLNVEWLGEGKERVNSCHGKYSLPQVVH